MANTIINASELDLSILGYATKKTNERGGSSMGILNKSIRGSLRMQTPMMLTWGASDYVDQKTGESDGKYSMALQFPEAEYSNEECESFLEKMIAFEQMIKDDALSKSKDWFGKEMKSAEVVEALYSPMLKYTKIKGTQEPDYSKKPTLRLKIPMWENVFKCELYDEEGSMLFPNHITNPSPMDFLAKGTQVMCVIQCGGLWFANGKFGVTWKLNQAVVQKPREQILQGKCLINLKPSDKAKFAAAPPPPPADEEESQSCNVVQDSDDDEPVVASEPEPEPVPEPEPEPVAVVPEKKVVRRVVKKSSA